MPETCLRGVDPCTSRSACLLAFELKALRILPAIWNNAPVSPAAVTPHAWFLLACVVGTVLLLLLLVAWLRLHAALGLSVAAIALGVVSGMPMKQVPVSFANGVGNMMGHIAIILGMGAIIGQLLASSGGGAALGNALVDVFGEKGVSWALLCLGILVGLPVFFEVGLVLLMPIVVETARRSKRPPILVGLPVLAGLSAMHGLVPPHPAAMLAATVYHADVGRSILWGLVVGIPAAALAGPIVGWFLMRRWERWQATGGAAAAAIPAPALGTAPSEAAIAGQPGGRGAQSALPPPAGAVRALVAILLPIALIFLGSWADAVTGPGSKLNQVLHLIGSPDEAMLIAALVALLTLGGRIQTGRQHGREMLRRLTADSFTPIAGVLVILSAAGALSGVLRDSGAAQATVGLAMSAHLPPLVLAWAMAAVVRICMGSATVAMAVASGVLAPMAGHMGVSPEMLMMATGCGSLILSHVNDSGFWLVGSLFNLDVKGTLTTWSVVETVLSFAGLGFTLLVATVVR